MNRKLETNYQYFRGGKLCVNVLTAAAAAKDNKKRAERLFYFKFFNFSASIPSKVSAVL